MHFVKYVYLKSYLIFFSKHMALAYFLSSARRMLKCINSARIAPLLPHTYMLEEAERLKRSRQGCFKHSMEEFTVDCQAKIKQNPMAKDPAFLQSAVYIVRQEYIQQFSIYIQTHMISSLRCLV
ncbi:UNVERIFIED_CONTAM: hypothetical protein K2H54_030921 [Gekko kuhli]